MENTILLPILILCTASFIVLLEILLVVGLPQKAQEVFNYLLDFARSVRKVPTENVENSTSLADRLKR